MGIADERTEGLQILVGRKFGKDAEAWGKASSTRTDYVSTRVNQHCSHPYRNDLLLKAGSVE